MSERHPAPKSTHGHRPSLVSSPPETGGGIEGELPTFKCPLWPGCNCPRGTMRPECPGLKGRKLPFNAGSARTQFKKGVAPQNTKYAGHERVNTDGYVEISIEEKNPHTGFERRYVHKHRLLWEQENGPIPKDMVLKCLDGNKANSAPSNWKCIPRGMLPRLNNQWGRNFEKASCELKPTIMAVAQLEHRTKEVKTV